MRHRYIHEVALATEIAADVARMNEKFTRVEAESGSHLLAQSKRHFAASPDLGAAGLICVYDARVWLDIGLVYHLGLKRILDDQVGAAKAIRSEERRVGKAR